MERDPNRKHTFTMTEERAELIHEMANDSCQSFKNWIVGAVEAGNLEYAQELAKELRKRQEIFAAFNIGVKRKYARLDETIIIHEAKASMFR